MKIDDWLWKISNKRPPKPYETYMQLVGIWAYIGCICGGFLIISIVLQQEGIVLWYLPLLIAVAFSVLLALVVIRQHKTEGYYNAIDEIGKKYWYDRAIKLGMIKDTKRQCVSFLARHGEEPPKRVLFSITKK